MPSLMGYRMTLPRGLAAAAVVYCLSGLVEYQPAFTSAAANRPVAALRGSAAAGRSAGRPAGSGFAAQSGAACLTVGLLGVGLCGAQRKAASRARTQRRADASGLTAGGPIVVYTNALMDAAAQKEESVPVTKDVMKIRSRLKDEAFLDELSYVVNETGQTEIDKAQGMIKLLQPLESDVTEKFITFLAKKKRLMALKPICNEYVTSLYDKQSIAPVVVRSAQRLTPEQIESVKEKMKAKTGAADIKLVCEVDAGLLGGFIIEWGFPDPENLATPTEGIDLSLKTYLTKRAINQGVVVEV
eukprot:CAMPEP_0168380048 /NCGR_PEP_ID=MMETSP0228-20121227/12157_1 /TAXON_ID=133427 /ORGANISM="Protoceratium reticulatum, Strain CCCM 535 (=CCMP 1889)" /LENGTH=299 /DNA_ID=CAMNT_0008393097 /DNA_START=49 /DNA_END=948 /DNA_ORIENTATION=+